MVLCDRSAMKGDILKGVVTMLLTRLQTNKMESYTSHFVFFALFAMALQNNGLTPDFLAGGVEAVGCVAKVRLSPSLQQSESHC